MGAGRDAADRCGRGGDGCDRHPQRWSRPHHRAGIDQSWRWPPGARGRADRLHIHGIGGSNRHKENGGIVFRITGQRVPSRFAGLVIERNIVWRVDCSGIIDVSDQLSPERWFSSTGVVIRDNYLDDVGGDGITPWATDGALVEHNIVGREGRRAPGCNAGLWQWSTYNALIQLNDVGATRGTLDGQGYNSDYTSRGTTFFHN